MVLELRFLLDAFASEGFNKKPALKRPTANKIFVAGMLRKISKTAMIGVATTE